MLWLRAAIAAILLPGTVLVWVPLWLLTSPGGTLEIGGPRWVGSVPLTVGTAGLVWCIWDFAHIGRGTLAPVDAPRFVIRGGLYRYVRNPMYLSVLTALAGEALLFQSVRLAVWAIIVAVAFHVFVLAHEEPTLRRQFGTDYDAYRRAVPRWRPRRPPPPPTASESSRP